MERLSKYAHIPLRTRLSKNGKPFKGQLCAEGDAHYLPLNWFFVVGIRPPTDAHSPEALQYEKWLDDITFEGVKLDDALRPEWNIMIDDCEP